MKQHKERDLSGEAHTGRRERALYADDHSEMINVE